MTDRTAAHEDWTRPPAATTGVIGWMRKNLFSSWLNSLMTLLAIYVLI
jgi:general L-amino acid transport system permease protein